jgi:hypothetical protein
MLWEDTLIHIREGVLNALVGNRTETVLNQASESAPPSNGVELAAEVKRAVNDFKVTATDQDGQTVDYSQLAESESYREYRQSCTAKLTNLDLDSLKYSQDQLAFWINLYNALTIDAVISFGINNSVTEGLLGIFSFFRGAAYHIGEHRFSLEDIEHGILRANKGHPYLPGEQFASTDPRRKWVISPMDPRIHFALNCASKSCPPIGVYTPEEIDVQLDIATHNFINTNLNVDHERGTLSLSSIFQWYRKDFGGRQGLIEFLLKHIPKDRRWEWVSDHRDSLKLNYQPYDWDLNKSAS